jgi:[CysO sulfur-carrier protein]-S-L-cysteine hydrolase
VDGLQAGLRVTEEVRRQMVAHCLAEYPLEGCGLLAAAPGSNHAAACYPTRNAAESARVYTIDPRDHLRADRDADGRGLEITGVFHSHTHTEAYPSPTDLAQAPVPGWHYVLVSLAGAEAMVRSFRIGDGKIEEEPLVVETLEAKPERTEPR